MAPTAKKRGRPALPPAERRLFIVRVRLTAAELAKFKALGGRVWFRAALRKSKR